MTAVAVVSIYINLLLLFVIVKAADRRQIGSAVVRFFKYAALVLVALIELFLLYWLFTLSLKNNLEITGSDAPSFPLVFHWENIDAYLMHSLIVTAVTVFINQLLLFIVVKAADRSKIGPAVVQFLKYSVLVLVAVIQLFPLYWLFTLSLKNNPEIMGGNALSLPPVLRWENYEYIFANANIGTYLKNSVIVTGATIAFSTVLATMASFAIARLKWKLSNKALTLFLSGMMIPLHAVLVPLLILLTETKLHSTYWALILPYTAFALPMAIYVFTGFFKTIPRELEESACLDGMNLYQIFWYIMLPLIMPAMATVAIFTYLACWNELMFAMAFMTGDNNYTITIGVANMAGRYATHFGRVGAGLAVATLPTLVIYVVLSKQIQKSFTTGALKG